MQWLRKQNSFAAFSIQIPFAEKIDGFREIDKRWCAERRICVHGEIDFIAQNAALPLYEVLEAEFVALHGSSRKIILVRLT